MQHVELALKKPTQSQPWGFRIQGGRDYNRPVVISRVTCGSLADKCGLKCGDEVVEIGSIATSCMSHNEAQRNMLQAGCNLVLKVRRLTNPVNSSNANNNNNINNSNDMNSMPNFQNYFKQPNQINVKALPRRCTNSNVQMSHSNLDLKFEVPICRSCGINIRGPFVVALEYCFCPGHFLCSCCQCDLTNVGFIELDGSFLCETDYSDKVAPVCGMCNQKIIGEEVIAKGRQWHPHCFRCNKCGIGLGDMTFQTGDDDKFYCEKDWNDIFQTKCDRCKQPITVLDQFIETDNANYHARCFCCSACKVPLAGKQYHSRNGRYFCKNHAYAGVMWD